MTYMFSWIGPSLLAFVSAVLNLHSHVVEYFKIRQGCCKLFTFGSSFMLLRAHRIDRYLFFVLFLDSSLLLHDHVLTSFLKKSTLILLLLRVDIKVKAAASTKMLRVRV